jgi:transposase
MRFIAGVDRSQRQLLPESLEDYVAKDAAVRFLDGFVESLDFGALGFVRSKPAATGRPSYSPADLLKLYLWGYLNKVCSSRKLERECLRNLEVIWLMGKLTPDFKTIADFRKDNAKAFKGVFRTFNLLCREMNLFGAELVAIDGTKLKAVNAKSRNHSRAELEAMLSRIDKRLDEFLSQLEEADKAEEGNAPATVAISDIQGKLEQLRERRQRYQKQLQSLEENGSKEYSETDPDSRRMKKVRVGYNAQIAVDSKHHLIVEQEVVQEANDVHQLAPMSIAAKEALGVEKLKVVADMGYYDHEQIAKSEQSGIEVYVPRPKKGSSEANGRFGKKDFTYSPDTDSYRCPQGATLSATVRFKKRGQMHQRYENPTACKECPIKEQCTTASHRTITRWHQENILDAMHLRVDANPQIIRNRRNLAEHPFGTMMFWSNQRALFTRGLEKVRGEFSFTALAYNITRVLNILGAEKLLKHFAMKQVKVASEGTLRDSLCSAIALS